MKKNEKIYREFINAQSNFNNLRLNTDIPRNINFEEGRQWSMDPALDNFPKITLNMIKQIGKTRKSNIMNNEYSYLLNSNNFKNIRKIQDFLKHLSELTDLKTGDLEALDDDYTKGTAIGYFFWDTEKRGFLQKGKGTLRYDVIDIRNFFVANPNIQDIQDQEWVMVLSRESKGSISSKYNIDLSKLNADGNLTTAKSEKELTTSEEKDELVNVLTKFYRNEDGEVLFTIVTENQVLVNEKAINPYFTGKKEEAENTMSLFDAMSEEEIKKHRIKENDPRNKDVWSLYPFVKFCSNKRDKNFYGVPIVTEYIEGQKSINNHFSVFDKAVQDNVIGGWVYRLGSLDAEDLTTDSGQMIGLNIPPTEDVGKALKRLPIANVPQDSLSYAQTLLSSQRSIAGASNIQLGQSDFSGQSAKQTQMLLDRAKENSSDTAMMFNKYKIDQAYIMFLFAKFYYDDQDFVVIKHGNQEDDVIEYSGENSFKGTELDYDYVTIDMRVGASPSFSEFTNLEIMGLSVQSGQLPMEAYIEMLPEGYISNKKEMIEILNNNSKKAIEELQQQLQQASQVIDQFNKAYTQLDKDRKNIDTVVKENLRLKQEMADIMAKSIQATADAQMRTSEMENDMRTLMSTLTKK